MVHVNKLLALLIVAALLLSACAPVIVPIPVPFAIEQSATPVTATTTPATTDLQSAPLLSIAIDLDAPRDIGSGDLGTRYVSYFAGGTVAGRNLEGEVLTDGAIWYLIRRNDCIAELVIQGVMQTTDGAEIAFISRGYSGVGPATMERVVQGQLVNPADALFRGVTFFNTEAEQYAWVNHATTITTYQYTLDQLHFVVYELHP